jgi:protease-4
LSTGFFLLFIALSGSLFWMMKSDDDSRKKPTLFSKGQVGIVELKGVIIDSKRFLKALEEFEEDEAVKGVVVRINSPGGSVAPSQEIYDAVKRFPKPLVASMASVAASGGFYVACGAKKVFANPGTITGSIGVIMEFINLEKLMEWAKVSRFSIKTGKFKDAGAPYRGMAPEEKELLQGMVDDVLGQFKTAVKEGRKLSDEEVNAVADGRIFSGSQAKKLKLVDELGGIEDAIQAVAKMADIKEKPEVVYPDRRKKFSWMDFFMNDGTPEDQSSSQMPSVLRKWVTVFAGVKGAAALDTLNDSSISPGVYWLWTGL